MKTLHLLVAHGSQYAPAQAACETLRDEYRQWLHDDEEVDLAYLEFAAPNFDEALAEAGRNYDRVVSVPLVLFAAGHFKNDIPLALARARSLAPHATFAAASEIGIDARLLALVRTRLRTCIEHHSWQAQQSALVVVGRGASDPDANAEFCKFVRLVSENLGFASVHAAFAGITSPTFVEALESAGRQRPKNLIVVPYLLFAGRVLARLQRELADFAGRQPWIASEILPEIGPHATLAQVAHDRALQALRGEVPTKCDTCVYRVPLTDLVERVGGYQSLLWSVRQRQIHNQVGALAHSHLKLKKHVLVCTNETCASQGSQGLARGLQHALRNHQAGNNVRVTATGCLGRCGHGPIVAVYPDGVWYRQVSPADSDELVREHLLRDRVVGRLIDAVLGV